MLSDRRRFVMREAIPDTSDLFDIFIIGGGGGGGKSPNTSWGLDAWAGAGGAGAYVNNLSNITLIPNQAYSVTIGAGGVGTAATATGGGTTYFGTYSAQGGGGAYFLAAAGSWRNGSWAGNGGSGGGAADGHGISGVQEINGSIGGSNGSDAPVHHHDSSADKDGLGDNLPKYLFGDVWLDLYCGGGGGGGKSAAEGYAGGEGGGGAGGAPGQDGTKYGAGGGGGSVAANAVNDGGSGYQGAVFIRKSSGTLASADFTYTGNWRWYRNNASLGIVEIYGDGVFTLA